jgi:hypothetical protein
VEATPLSALVGQQLVIAPTQRTRFASELGWASLPGAAELGATLDTALHSALSARDVGRNWIFPDALRRSYARNPTYATDPRALSVESLRTPPAQSGARLTEPLASQLRTMIALHEARLVLIPVDLRIEQVAIAGQETPGGRAFARLVLIDPRSSDIRWATEVSGDAAPSIGPALVGTLAERITSLFAPR